MAVSLEFAAAALATLSAFDGRTYATNDDRQAKIHAWAAALDSRTTPTDFQRAVAEHYANSTQWAMPAHINTLTRQYRQERARKEHQTNIQKIYKTPRGITPMPPEIKKQLENLLAQWRTNRKENK